jgi:hypothetical protein
MFAYRMRELFKAHGRLLPISEGSVRPLSELRVERQRTKTTLTLEELQLKAWDIAVAMKQRSTPTGIDVRRAVRRLTGPKVDTSTDPAFRAYRRHFHRIKTELATATKRMPDLAAFLADDDKKTKRQKKDLARLIEKEGMSLINDHFMTLDGTWTPNKRLFEKGDYLAALARVARLERMVVIFRVRDFRSRSNHSLIKHGNPKAGAPARPLPDVAYAQSLDMWTQTVGLNPDPKSAWTDRGASRG